MKISNKFIIKSVLILALGFVLSAKAGAQGINLNYLMTLYELDSKYDETMKITLTRNEGGIKIGYKSYTVNGQSYTFHSVYINDKLNSFTITSENNAEMFSYYQKLMGKPKKNKDCSYWIRGDAVYYYNKNVFNIYKIPLLSN